MENIKTVTVLKESYDKLYYDSLFLSLLENHGVYNWDGYGYAKEELEQIKEDNE